MKYQQDYYQILGVKRDATPEQIRIAYRQLVKLNHPDRNLSPLATEKMQQINEAYAVIGDKNKRPEYDFAYFDSSTTFQTKASSYKETTDLQEFSGEANPILLMPVSGWLVFFLVATALCWVVIMTLFSNIPFLADLLRILHLSIGVLFLATPLFVIGTIAIVIFWKSSQSSEKENQCPQCGKGWAAEKLEERSMGIFKRSVDGGSRYTYMGLITCQKYQIHYKCNYCSYEWLFTTIRTV